MTWQGLFLAGGGFREWLWLRAAWYGKARLGSAGSGSARQGKGCFELVAVSANLKPWRRGAGLGAAMRG